MPRIRSLGAIDTRSTAGGISRTPVPGTLQDLGVEVHLQLDLSSLDILDMVECVDHCDQDQGEKL